MPGFNLKEESEFIQACAEGELDKVKLLFAENPLLINIPASNGSLPLMFAAGAGHASVVEWFIEQKEVNIDAIAEQGDNKGASALWYAALNGHWDIVEQLFMAGAESVNASPENGNNKGVSILWLAVVQERWDLVRMLLVAGANNIDGSHEAIEETKKLTLLFEAVRMQQWPVVKKILESGARKLDIVLSEGPLKGATPLLLVAFSQHWEIVDLILAAGAQNLDAALEAGDEKEITVLWLAANVYGQSQLVQKLLEMGVTNIDVAPTGGPYKNRTALCNAIIKHDNATVQALLQYGADIDSPLAYFCSHESENKIRHTKRLNQPIPEADRADLLTYGMQYESAKNIINCANALFKHAISGTGTIEELNKILDILGVGLNGCRNNKTALQVAIENEHTVLIDLLVARGALRTNHADMRRARREQLLAESAARAAEAPVLSASASTSASSSAAEVSSSFAGAAVSSSSAGANSCYAAGSANTSTMCFSYGSSAALSPATASSGAAPSSAASSANSSASASSSVSDSSSASKAALP